MSEHRNVEARCPVCGAYYVFGRDWPPWRCEHVSFGTEGNGPVQMYVHAKPAPAPGAEAAIEAITMALGEEADAPAPGPAREGGEA